MPDSTIAAAASAVLCFRVYAAANWVVSIYQSFQLPALETDR
jgi:hypothetical protein